MLTLSTLPVVLLSALNLPPAPAERISLDGTWRLTPIVQNGKKIDAPRAREILVPGDWERLLGSDFDGTCVYERDMTLELRPNERVFLRFRAAMTHATVEVNGRILGEHLGGWTPFSVEATEALRGRTQHVLRVTVDERVGHNTQGFLPAIQPHFGGLWQSGELVRTWHAAFDTDDSEIWAKLDDEGPLLQIRAALRRPGAVRAELALHNERGRVAGRQFHLNERESLHELSWRPKQKLELWSPQRPNVYRAILRIFDAQGFPLDTYEQSLGFRSVDVAQDGRTILINGKPVTFRGILHWGYEPPHLAPDESPEHWAWLMRYTKSLGFNMIKACLWLPPLEFYEAALREGVLVWNEYPTWHPDLSAKHKDALLQEYEEFFRYDRSLAPVVARSLTCETGHHMAEKAVIEALFHRCKAVTEARLVIDDSSWISWSRFGDFFDDHPYGNCGDWLGRLDGFDRFIAEKGPKPFLLGEAITSDTWLDFDKLESILSEHSDEWWRPYGWEHQLAFQERLRQRYGHALVDELRPASERYGLLARKYQIETMRRRLPRAGYVSSVMRDFTKARMGFLDDLGEPKWTAADWSWHGERMFVLDDARPVRSVLWPAGEMFGVPRVRISGPAPKYSHALTMGIVEREWLPRGGYGNMSGGSSSSMHAQLKYEGLSSPAMPTGNFELRLASPAANPGSVLQIDLHAKLGAMRNDWRFYAFPKVPNRGPKGVVATKTLDRKRLEWIREGGRLLLLPGGRGSLKSQRHWFLRGAPWAPQQHPLWQRVPREMLLELQAFDFDGPVFKGSALAKSFDPIFGLWDSHDLADRLDEWLFLAEARVGKGRILVCSLDLSLKDETPFGEEASATKRPNPARAWLRHTLLEYLANGPAAVSALSDEQVANWMQALEARDLALDGVWKLRTDKEDEGVKAGWSKADHDASEWLDSKTGVHWEHAGLPQYTGIAWYQKRFELPADWPEKGPCYLVFDGVDDSYQLWVNGKHAGSFGDPMTGETVWLIRTQAQVGDLLKPGTNTVTLRVVDHAGAGGIWKPVRLTTADPDVAAAIESGR